MRYLTLLLGVVLFLGCGEDKKAPVVEAPKPPEKKADAPKLPGEDEADASTEVLVKDETYAATRKKDDYVQDEKKASGALRGLCVVTPPKGMSQAPAEKPLDVSLPQARDGELAYYQNLKLKTRGQPWWMADKVNRSGQFGVIGAVLTLRGVKQGKRAPMVRPSYLIKNGNVTTSWGSGPWGPFSSAPVGERANIGTYDGYSCQIVFTRLDGMKKMSEGDVSAFDKDTVKPLGGGGLHFTARPKMVQSPPLLETGIIEISCARHAWQKGYLCVWDSPYVCVVPGHYDPEQAGKFTFDGIPAGRHTMEIWHPTLEPAQKTVEIEIKENETTELKIDFNWTAK